MHRVGYGDRHGASRPSPVAQSPRISTCSPTQKLFETCPFRFLWRLHYVGMTVEIIGHCDWTQSPGPLPSPEVRGWDWSSQPSNHMAAPLATCTHPKVLSRSPCWHNKNHLLLFSTLNVPPIWGAMSQEPWRKMEYERNIYWYSE